MQKSLIAGLLFALVLVVFALKNSTPVELDFIIGNKVHGTLSLILLITLIIGIFVGLLLSYPSIKKFKNKITDDTAEITKLTNILDEYKKEYGINKKTKEEKEEMDNPSQENNA